MNILGLGLPELIVITLVLLLFFGAKRLPGLFRSIGTSISELKAGLNVEDKPQPPSKQEPVTSTHTNTPDEPPSK